jgi:hypothetical protein
MPAAQAGMTPKTSLLDALTKPSERVINGRISYHRAVFKGASSTVVGIVDEDSAVNPTIQEPRREGLIEQMRGG